jgi:hypothetical protein
MSIEIRQLKVNANVQNQETAHRAGQGSNLDPELLKAEILAACRDMIRHWHQQQQER